MGNDCSISYLEIYEGKESLEHKRKMRYCEQAVPPSIVSNGDTLGDTRVQTASNVILSDETGEVASPGMFQFDS